MRQVTRRSALALALVGALAAPATSMDPPKDRVDPKARAAARDRALRWLSDHVLSLPDVQGTPRKPFTVAIAGLDFLMASGTGSGRGSLERIRGCRDAVVRWLGEAERRVEDPAELPDAHGVADSRRLVQYTWPSAAAVLFFAECQARDVLRSETRGPLERAARLLANAQDPNGGWGHGRISGRSRGGDALLPSMPGRYPSTLVSATNMAATALGLARPYLPDSLGPTLRKASEHYPRAILRSGNFPYDVSQRSADFDTTGVGRTAGAIAAMLALGTPPTAEPVRRAGAFLDERLALLAEGHGSPAMNVFFGALQARLRGPKSVEAFEERVLPRVLGAQAADGWLDCVCERKGFGVTCDSPSHGLLAAAGVPAFERTQQAYVTALHLFALLLDDRDRLRVLVPASKAPLPRAPEVTPSEPAPRKDEGR
jgi:hypothetical protein